MNKAKYKRLKDLALYRNYKKQKLVDGWRMLNKLKAKPENPEKPTFSGVAEYVGLGGGLLD